MSLKVERLCLHRGRMLRWRVTARVESRKRASIPQRLEHTGLFPPENPWPSSASPQSGVETLNDEIIRKVAKYIIQIVLYHAQQGTANAASGKSCSAWWFLRMQRQTSSRRAAASKRGTSCRTCSRSRREIYMVAVRPSVSQRKKAATCVR
jgi:hypothetical protein